MINAGLATVFVEILLGPQPELHGTWLTTISAAAAEKSFTAWTFL